MTIFPLDLDEDDTPRVDPLPCTRCRSTFDIAPGDVLCRHCRRDDERASRADNDQEHAAPTRRPGVGSHVANTLPAHDR